MIKTTSRLPATVSFMLMLSCTTEKSISSEESEDTAVSTDTAQNTEDLALYENFNFTHKMMKNTDENLFSALAYECSECTFAQHQAITPPEGWSKGPTQVALHSSGELRSTPSFEGEPDSMDFVPEVPGNEYILIAKNLDATIIESGPSGVIVRAQVMRDTLLIFSAGQRVHELTDPEGNIFVLFAYEVDPNNVVIPDFQDPNVLDDLSKPNDWVYSTRILEEELQLDTADVATVLAIRTDTASTWEMR